MSPHEAGGTGSNRSGSTPGGSNPGGSTAMGRPDNRPPRWVYRAMAVFFAGLATLWAARAVLAQLRGLIVIIVLSLFLALALEPAVNALARRGWRRGVATATVMLGFLAAFAGFMVAMGALVVDQVNVLADRLPEIIDEAIAWVNDTFDTTITADDLSARVRDWVGSLADDTLSLGTQVLGGLLNTLTVGLFTFYLVADGPRMRRALCSMLPADRQRTVLRVWEIGIDKTGGYLYSRFLLALLSGFFTAIALSAIGVSSPIALGLWVGLVSQFLPVVGTYLAGVLPVGIAAIDSTTAGLWTLAFVVVYQQIENYLFAPRITARTLEVHPAVAFGSVLAGTALLGAIGALLAIPAAASAQAFASTLVARHDVVDSHLVDLGRRRTGDGARRRRRPGPADGAGSGDGASGATGTAATGVGDDIGDVE